LVKSTRVYANDFPGEREGKKKITPGAEYAATTKVRNEEGWNRGTYPSP